MSVPIYEKLKRHYSENRVSFAMPGHKNGRGLTDDFSRLDVTELDSTLNLYALEDETVNSAKKLLSKLYGSDESYILTGGSTAGIQAMLASVLSPGDTLLVSGDCHMSVINTCALCGYNLVFIPASFDTRTYIPCDRENAADVVRKAYSVDAVLVTSPNYYGFCRDIPEIAAACRERGVPLLVDEAHGAHFTASPRLPKSAVLCGADAVVNSAHKTLNALTGAAYLHIKGDLINKSRLHRALMMFQTSSPSYPIAASADIARQELEDSDVWDKTVSMCDEFKRLVEENTFIHVVENDDPTRIVLNFSGFDMTGYEADKILSEKYSVDIEMADILNIVLIATPSNTRDDFDRMLEALYDICDSLTVSGDRKQILPPPEHSKYIEPQQAFYGKVQRVAPAKSFGRICAETVTAYPPGIPIICMGEEITAGHIGYIRHLQNCGAKFTGFDGDMLSVLK